MEIGTVRQVDIDSEMRAAYLDYAMSVIVSRALPDARDGLKPVHRRILYAMHDMGLRADSPYRKSARIVGEVLGKYHPHGDAAVYDAMVRMAQDFSMRYPLVDGQGNFGSIDGDSAAAMRYTEARMDAPGVEMLRDIEKDTIAFGENFDGSLKEPLVLPSSIPNLLVNGATGIAVGMSTSIPPHNLGEVCDALIYMIDRWDQLEDIGLPELSEYIKGPDFPTGGVVFRYHKDGETDSLAHAYATGRGRITVQAKAHVEQLSRNRNRIVITELPYQINKTNLLERIADLHRDEKIEGLTDLRDESDRQGMRIVIDLTRTVDPYEVLAELYAKTPMRQTFSIIMLALVDNEPRLLSLKQALRVFLNHRFEIVRKRSEYELAQAQARAHILEGYLIALDNLDEVIDTIRHSRTVETAHSNLMKKYKLSDEQAQAVLNMPLRRLAAMERRKIEEVYKELCQQISYLEGLLKSEGLIRKVIQEELEVIRKRYADPRRTLIVDAAAGEAVTVAEFLSEEKTWVVMTESGLLSRTVSDEQPKVTTALKDPPRLMIAASANETLYLFTSQGEACTIPVHQLPQVASFEDGAPFASISPLADDSVIVAGLTRSMSVARDAYLFLGTKDGMVKRVDLEDLPGLSASVFPVIGLTDDELRWAVWTSGADEVFLVSAKGQAIRFNEDDVRPMGLPAGGVKGMKLKGRGDCVVGMAVAQAGASLWVITNDGIAKSSPMDDYPMQGRYGQGVITMKLAGSEQVLAAAAAGIQDQGLIVVTNKGKPKYMRLGLAPESGRNTKGNKVVALGLQEEVAYVVLPQSYSPAVEEGGSESVADDG
nr:DNA gyrase subunit A [Anaerolineae bacterium]